MGAEQRKFRLRVIEAVDVVPGFGAVAGFAAEGGSVGALAGHFLIELTLMRILVASGAVAVLKAERKDFVSAPCKADLVAVRAGYRRVCSSERVPGFAMFRDGVG